MDWIEISPYERAALKLPRDFTHKTTINGLTVYRNTSDLRAICDDGVTLNVSPNSDRAALALVRRIRAAGKGTIRVR